MKLAEMPEVADLSTREKIVLLEELWDSIRDDQEHIPVPDSHKAELDKRFNRHIANAVLRHPIESVCRKRGYEPPVICTPLELME